jgi:ABC-type glucose/galactose transport system permease subunit
MDGDETTEMTLLDGKLITKLQGTATGLAHDVGNTTLIGAVTQEETGTVTTRLLGIVYITLDGICAVISLDWIMTTEGWEGIEIIAVDGNPAGMNVTGIAIGLLNDDGSVTVLTCKTGETTLTHLLA